MGQLLALPACPALPCPAPASTRKFRCRWVSDHLSQLWLGHHLRKVREPSTNKVLRAGSGAWLVHVSDPYYLTNTDAQGPATLEHFKMKSLS